MYLLCHLCLFSFANCTLDPAPTAPATAQSTSHSPPGPSSPPSSPPLSNCKESCPPKHPRKTLQISIRGQKKLLHFQFSTTDPIGFDEKNLNLNLKEHRLWKYDISRAKWIQNLLPYFCAWQINLGINKWNLEKISRNILLCVGSQTFSSPNSLGTRKGGKKVNPKSKI